MTHTWWCSPGLRGYSSPSSSAGSCLSAPTSPGEPAVVDLYEWARGFGETVLLYLDDPYLREAAATLLDSSCDKPGRCYLVFDKSIFHPRSGRQPSDTGFVIDQGFSFKVEKVLMVKGVLAHYGRVLQGSPPVKGSLVKLLLDWETRHLVIRLHTAGHVLDYAVSKAYGRVVNTLDAHHGPPRPTWSTRPRRRATSSSRRSLMKPQGSFARPGR
ncbi:MAG: alanine--tRNA ligase-related protein [Thermosphaera sp.]